MSKCVTLYRTEQEGKQNPEKETLRELPSYFIPLSTPHSDAREPYGD